MPARRVEFHPDAVVEAQAAKAWYENRNTSAADAFVDELDHAVAQIAEAPNRWPRYIAGTRRYLLHRFPFSVVYRESGSTIPSKSPVHFSFKSSTSCGRARPSAAADPALIAAAMDRSTISSCLDITRNLELHNAFSHIVEEGIVSQSHQLL